MLPLFLFLMLTILYLFQVGMLQMQMKDALYDLAVLKARTAYLTQDAQTETSSAASILDSAVLAASSSLSIQDAIDEDLAELIVGGRSGIICIEDADQCSENMTALQAQCIVKLPVSVFGGICFTITESVSVRNWTGLDPDETGSTGMVYVTANGTVYHADRNCSYLNPSVETVSASDLKSARNSSGHIYYACSLCGDQETAGTYYITTYGESYHTSLSCSGLKRTVYLVSRDETDLPACSKCGGSDE